MTLIQLISEYGKECHMEGWHRGSLDALADDEGGTVFEKSAKMERRKAERTLKKIYKLIGVQ